MKRLSFLVLAALLVLACGDSEGGTSNSGGTSSTGGSGGSPATGGGPSSGGGPTTGGMGGMPAGPMMLTSPAFMEGGTIPLTHECGMQFMGPGDDVSPQLDWTPGPSGTLSYAIIMRDLDFMNLLHWVVYDIPASALSLPEDVPGGFMIPDPAGAKQALNQGVLQSYLGPCSSQEVNTYEFTVYAINVDTLPGMDAMSSVQDVEAAVLGAALESATLSGES